MGKKKQNIANERIRKSVCVEWEIKADEKLKRIELESDKNTLHPSESLIMEFFYFFNISLKFPVSLFEFKQRPRSALLIRIVQSRRLYS